MNEILYVGQKSCSFVENHVGSLISCNDEKIALDIVKKNNIRAILEDVNLIRESGFFLVSSIVDDPLLSHIPVIGVMEKYDDGIIPSLLEEGICDVIIPPCPPLLLQKRIVNAIKSAGSVTFDEMEGMLRELPSNIYLKDHKGRYVFATHYWDHIKHDEPGFTIKGKTDLEIRKDKENALIAMKADKQILETGRPQQYVIQERTKEGIQFLELIKCPVKNSIGKVTGIVGLINDVTQMELLRRELEERSKKDALTGLYNKASVQDKIEEVLPEYQKGALFMIDLDDFKGINDTFGHHIGDNVLSVIGDLLKLGFEDGIVGRFGGDEFVAFIGGIGYHEANQMAKAFCKQVKSAFGGKLKGKIGASVGICVYPDGGDEFRILYENADKALYKIKQTGKGDAI